MLLNSSSRRKRHNIKKMCKVLDKFFKSCKTVGFTTNLSGTSRSNSSRDGDCGNVARPTVVVRSSSLKDHMCKVLDKFFKSCKTVGFTTNLSGTSRSNSSRDGDCGNVARPTVVVRSSSLKDHLAAAKIQSAYRRHMMCFRNRTTSSCPVDADCITMECNKHGSSETSVSLDIQPDQAHLARNTTITHYVTHEALLKFHRSLKMNCWFDKLMYRRYQGMIRIDQTRKASDALHLESPNYIVSGFGSPKSIIPHPRHQKFDISMLHLEPKSRNRTIQRRAQNISILDCYGLCSSVPHRLLRKTGVDNTGQVPVYLNVYDITPINCCLYWLGLGAHHSGVQVNEAEYAFGTDEYGRTGILKTSPKECELFTFRKRILIGCTMLRVEEVNNVIEQLEVYYQLKDYHLVHNNCNHFSNQLCIRLTGNSIPPWVNRLARIGSLFVRWSKKNYKNGKKEMSGSKRLTNSSSSSSSMSSDITIIGKSNGWRTSVEASSLLHWII